MWLTAAPYKTSVPSGFCQTLTATRNPRSAAAIEINPSE